MSDYDPNLLHYYLPGTHWKVKWDEGATNNGSSGAPYFNYKGQVIGQHRGIEGGGDQGCGYSFSVFGGRLAYAWDQDYNSTFDGPLKDWLDPYNNNPTSINGIESDAPPQKPTNLGPTSGGGSPLQLSWYHNKPADFDHYDVYRAGMSMKPGVSCGNMNFQLIGTTTNKSFTDEEVIMWGNKSCNFSYYVKATDDNGFESPASDIAVVNGEYIGPQNKTIEQEELVFTNLEIYPNPFNFSTTIQFSLPKKAEVNIQVFNTNGRQVMQLMDEQLSAGFHQVKLDAKSLASGTYLIRIEALKESGNTTRKVLNVHLIK